MRKFMIDIESTGVDQNNDDIIEIGIVSMFMGLDGFYTPSRDHFHLLLHTNKKPESNFAKKHMTELYEKANKADFLMPDEVRSLITDWLRTQGASGSKDTQFCGWNSSTFDTPFMVKKGYLIPSGYDADDNLTGDFHYRPYEISGAIEVLSDATGYKNTTIRRMAQEHRLPPFIEMPKGKSHDAIYDCYNQINIVNGLIAIARGNHGN